MIINRISDYKRFMELWDKGDINKADELIRYLGYNSAQYNAEERYWYIDDDEYTFFVLTWG